jgi:hypothetical protein
MYLVVPGKFIAVNSPVSALTLVPLSWLITGQLNLNMTIPPQISLNRRPL